MGRFLAVAMVLAGCAPLEAIPAHVCGNGVVDAGEACDGSAPPPLTCRPPSDPQGCTLDCSGGRPCQSGWSCDGGGVCVHATGAFEEVQSFDLPGNDFFLRDFDGDGRQDLVSPQGHLVRLVYGDGAGRFGGKVGLRDELALPLTSGLLDVLPGTGPGVMAMPSTFGTLLWSASENGPRSARPVPSIWTMAAPLLEGAVPMVLEAACPQRTLQVTLVDLAEVDAVPWQGPYPCDASVRPAHLDVDGDGVDEAFLAAPDGGIVAIKAVPYGLVRGWHPQVIAIPAPGGQTPGLLVTEVDGDAEPELVIRTADGAVAYSASDLALAIGGGPPPLVRDLPAIATSGWPLAAGDLDGDGQADLVGPEGIFLNRAGPVERVLARRGPSRWTEAVVLDQPGGPVVAIAMADPPGLALMRCLAPGPGCEGPVEIDVPVSGVPGMLRAGDFDGDGLVDLAFVDLRPDGASVAIAYLDGAGNPDVRVVRDLADGEVAVSGLEPVRLPAPDLTNDGRVDLVLSLTDASGGTLRELVLSLERRGSFYFQGLDLPSLGPWPAVPTFAALTGSFVDAPQVLEISAAGDATVATLPGAVPLAIDMPAPWCAVTLVADLDGDGRDEAYLAGPRQGCVSPNAPRWLKLTVDTSRSVPTLLAVGGSLPGPVQDLLTAHLDPRGKRQLLVISGGQLSILQADGTQQSVLTPAPLTSAAAVQADEDPEDELAALGAGQLWVGDKAGWVSNGIQTGTRVRAADLDGDGVPDLVIGDGSRMRELRALTRAAPGRSP